MWVSIIAQVLKISNLVSLTIIEVTVTNNYIKYVCNAVMRHNKFYFCKLGISNTIVFYFIDKVVVCGKACILSLNFESNVSCDIFWQKYFFIWQGYDLLIVIYIVKDRCLEIQ